MENSNENEQHGKKKSLHIGDILFFLVEVGLILVSFKFLLFEKLIFYLSNF